MRQLLRKPPLLTPQFNATRCYRENTTKEELVLEHVLDFEKQFEIIYNPDRKLLLAPLNECQVRKFICTTIRPTQLPYTKLYEWGACAKFVADFLEYEELDVDMENPENPPTLPKVIPSPANVLEWQAGDSFDFSIVLCSLLIGAGYDAYCVYGAAPKFITTKDESLMDCPPEFINDMPQDDDNENHDPDADQMKQEKPQEAKIDFEFQIMKPPLKSEFVEQNKLEEEKEKDEKAMKAETIDDDAPDLEKKDDLEDMKKRMHCWVLLK